MTYSESQRSDSPDLAEHTRLIFRISQVLRGSGGAIALTIRDAVVPIAILLFLRWLEHYEKEHAANAALDGKEHLASIPDELRWSTIAKLSGNDLAHHLSELFVSQAMTSRDPAVRERYVRDFASPRIAQIQSGQFARRLRRMTQVWPRLLELPNDVRETLVEVVSELPFEHLADRQAAEQLLAEMIREGSTPRSGFFTPQAAVDLMVEIADPMPGERVYDPCFGAGGLLVAAVRRLHDKAGRLTSRDWEETQERGIYGVEHYPEYYFVGLVRVTLAGADHPGLELGDALERERIGTNIGQENFDCVLANPPWRATRKTRRDIGFDVPTAASEGLFVQHIMDSLRPGGRAVIALPANFLFGGGPERRIRKLLVEGYRIEGVVGLPANVFKPYTSVSSSLLIIRRAGPAERIRFVKCDALAGAGSASKALNPQSAQDISRLLKSDEEGPNAWTTTIWEIEQREWDLSPRRTGANELDGLLKEISALDSAINVLRLDQVALVSPGTSYKSADVSELSEESTANRLLASLDPTRAKDSPVRSKSGAELIPLIRVGDIQKGRVSTPRMGLHGPDVRERLRKRMVAPGDLVISVVGTIGKIGVVGPEAEGALASTNVNVIRIRDRSLVDGRYLVALLGARAYQNWASGHARGSVIQHLSLKALGSLPVPIAPLPIQQRVIGEVEATGADAIEQLLRILKREESDPVALWLEQIPIDMLEAHRPLGSTSIAMLESVAKEVRSVRNRVAHDSAAEGTHLREWLMALANVVPPLAGISDVPPGVPRISILERARFGLTQAISVLERGAPGDERARQFTSALVNLLEAHIEDAIGFVQITPSVRESEVTANIRALVTVALRNESGAPLRNFEATAEPFEGTATSNYFAEGSALNLALTIPPSELGNLNLTIRWRAARLDGLRVSGESPIVFRVVPARVLPQTLAQSLDGVAESSAKLTDVASEIGPNPYISAGTPVDRAEMLYGRRPLIATIKRFLGSSTQSAVIFLQGNRRAGKSSILRQLFREPDLDAWVIALCDFQDIGGHPEKKGVPTDNIFIHMAYSIAEGGLQRGFHFWPTGQRKPESFTDTTRYLYAFRQAFRAASKVDSPFEVLRDVIVSALDTIKPRRLLWMLDEFDKIQEGIDSGVTSPQIPQNIRALLNNNPNLGAILTGSRKMTELKKDYWHALFGLGTSIDVTAIDRAEAIKLVAEPVAKTLAIAAPVAERVVDVCSAQPYLIQMLCSRIFDNCARSGDRVVTLEAIETTVEELVTNWPHFEPFWTFAEYEQTRFLLFVIDRASSEAGGDAVSLTTIEDLLQESGVQMRRDALIGDHLKALMQLELVANETGGRYRISVPLFAHWMHRNKDYQDQLERARMEVERKGLA